MNKIEVLAETPDGKKPEKPARPAMVVVGEIIADKFRVDRILGQGGMGVVVLATHLVLDEQFALKLLRPEIAEDSETVERFSREAKACVRIKSEHVARVHDVGMRRDGTPFMVMEYLEGTDLGTALHEGGPLPIDEGVEYIIQACEALAQAHAIGIVHRDIKPENLFLVNNLEGWRSIKLLDFGISKAIPAPAPRSREPTPRSLRPEMVMTQVRETRMMGTPHYMSPEQMQQLDNVDGRSDIWSLGVVLYELLTGHYAWNGANVQEVTQSILKEKAPWLGDIRPEVPPQLSAIVDRCLEKDPDRRFPNVAELAIALLPFAPRRARVSAERSVSVVRASGLSSPDLCVPTSVHPPPLAATGPAVTLPAMSIPRGPTMREAPTMPDLSAELERHRWFTRGRAALAVLGIAGLAAGAFSLWGSQRGSAASRAPLTAGVASLPSGGGTACERNDDCIRARGADWICRTGTHRCVNLKSDDCQRVVGDAKSDDAVIFGSLLPLGGEHAGVGTPIENSIELALEDFRLAGFIPPAPGKTQRRPIAIVACNEGSESATGVRAARHLTDDVGVPAIIGAGYSGMTMQVATEVTIPRNVLLFTPASTSVTLTRLSDNGLLWRSCPSDTVQVDAHLALMPLVERDVKSRLPAGTNLKVAVVHKGDAHGIGMGEELTPLLSFNGYMARDPKNRESFRRIDYGDPADTERPPDYAAATARITSFAPHVILLFGSAETVTSLLSGTESSWPEGQPRPFYMMADGSAIPALSHYLKDKPDEMRRRIVGTKPGNMGENYVAFKETYESRIHDRTSPESPWAVNAYDALYLLAYSVASLGNDPATGPNLARGFSRQVSGKRIATGSSNINRAFELLLAGESIDFDGASGPLDFDPSIGEATSDILYWCIQRDGSGNLSDPRASPVYYGAISHMLVGDYEGLRSFCGF